MKDFFITIKETYSRIVKIKAETKNDAFDIATGIDIVMRPQDYVPNSTQYKNYGDFGDYPTPKELKDEQKNSIELTDEEKKALITGLSCAIGDRKTEDTFRLSYLDAINLKNKIYLSL